MQIKEIDKIVIAFTLGVIACAYYGKTVVIPNILLDERKSFASFYNSHHSRHRTYKEMTKAERRAYFKRLNYTLAEN